MQSMGFPRQEFWSGLPLPSPEDLPDPGIKPASPAVAGLCFTTEPPQKPSQKNKRNSSPKAMFWLCFASIHQPRTSLLGNEVFQTLNFPPWLPTLSEEAPWSLDLFPPVFSHWVTFSKNSKRNCYFHWIPFHAFLIMRGRRCVSG